MSTPPEPSSSRPNKSAVTSEDSYPTGLKKAFEDLGKDRSRLLLTRLYEAAEGAMKDIPEQITESWTETNRISLLLVEVAYVLEFCCRKTLPEDPSEGEEARARVQGMILYQTLADTSNVTKVVKKVQKYLSGSWFSRTWFRIRHSTTPHEYFQSRLQRALELFNPSDSLKDAATQLMEHADTRLAPSINESKAPQIKAFLVQLKSSKDGPEQRNDSVK